MLAWRTVCKYCAVRGCGSCRQSMRYHRSIPFPIYVKSQIYQIAEEYMSLRILLEMFGCGCLSFVVTVGVIGGWVYTIQSKFFVKHL